MLNIEEFKAVKELTNGDRPAALMGEIGNQNAS